MSDAPGLNQPALGPFGHHLSLSLAGASPLKASSRYRLEAQGRPGQPHSTGYVDLAYHHPLEDYLGRPYVRRLLGWLARDRRGGKPHLQRMFETYGAAGLSWWERLGYWPAHYLMTRIKGQTPTAVFRQRISEHSAALRGLVNTARSVAEFGLTRPQRFWAPLFVVWNFTQLCNLRCRHCYQSAAPQKLPDELTLAEKLDLIDQLGRAYVPMVAFAGGEPTIHPDLEPALRRCQQHGIHTSLATNGVAISPERARAFADLGVRYVEVSLDYVDPEAHDRFRGVPGMWRRAVRGIENVARQKGLRAGLAMCVHRGNLDQVPAMIRLAKNLGAVCFAHFNFIPVGRGKAMLDDDLDPVQREALLELLNEEMQKGEIGVLSTAPQLGRVALVHAPDSRMALSHTGSAGGGKARVVAKYIGGCGAGRCYVAIEPRGDITPCVYMPDHILGNVRQRAFLDIYRNNPLWDLMCDRSAKRRAHHCAVCDFKAYCGGCRARADAYFGDPAAGDPGCIFNQAYWEELRRQAGAAEPAVLGAAAEGSR